MGRLKDYYINQVLGQQRWVSSVFYECPKCGELNQQDVEVPEPNFMAEKSRDMASEGDVELHCEHCGECFGGDAWASPADCVIELWEYPNTHVTCEPPGYDRPPEDWLDDWEIPESPLDVFERNTSELKSIIAAQASDDGGKLINRMIFAQILTFLEAYLCDNLIKGLREYPDRRIAFAEIDGAIKGAQISASEVLRDPDAVKNWIERNLRNRLYHQFGSGAKDNKTGKPKPEGVVLWYGTAFGFSIAPSAEDLDALRTYAVLRHDCVHRNGVTKDGEELTMFDKAFLLNSLDVAERVVRHIDTKMSELSVPKEEF